MLRLSHSIASIEPVTSLLVTLCSYDADRAAAHPRTPEVQGGVLRAAQSTPGRS